MSLYISSAKNRWLASKIIESRGCADATTTSHITNISNKSKVWSEEIYDGMVLLG
jgi:hypothetical protein